MPDLGQKVTREAAGSAKFDKHNIGQQALLMKLIKVAGLAGFAILLSATFGSSATIAGDRWDGKSLCVEHKTRNVSAATANKCPSGATLRSLESPRAGLDGTIIHSGEGTPTVEVGESGDFYLDLAAGTLYGPRSATTWSSSISLKGKDGSSGSGSRGPAGPQGPAGTDASPSFGFALDTSWTPITSSGEQQAAYPNDYYTGFSVLFDTVNEISLSPGVYFVNLSGSADHTVAESDSSGVCTLHLSSEVDAGYQVYTVGAGAESFSVAGYIEIYDENDGITLECMAYYNWNGNANDRDEYTVQGTVLRVDQFESLDF